MGWFFGFKLHLLINHQGEIRAFKITSGNVDDRQPLEPMVSALRGKVFADKGYISKSLMKRLWQRGLHLLTGIRRNMKNYLLPLLDRLLLRKPCIIETLFAKLKVGMGLEHSRHRSPTNALVHILSSLAAYTLAQPKVRMGTVPIPSLSSPYPQLGFLVEGSPSHDKRHSRQKTVFHGVTPVSCGSDGAGWKAGCPARPASYGFCPCHTLYPPSPLPQAAGPCATHQHQ